jgi:hypothetical protein
LRFIINQAGRRNKKLVKNVETIQTRLHRLGRCNKPYSAVVAEVRRKHYKEKFFEHLLRSAELKTKTRSALKSSALRSSVLRGKICFGLIMLSLAILGMAAYYFISEPGITGAVVENVIELSSDEKTTPILGWLVFVFIFSSGLGFVYNKTVTK